MVRIYIIMFVAQALYNFSKLTVAADARKDQQQEPLYKKQQNGQQQEQTLKRKREKDHDQELAKEGEDRFFKKSPQQEKDDKGQKPQEIAYLSFEKGDRILVEQAFENGWWFGNVIKKANQKGFFPSNYVKVGAKPPPPAPPKQKEESQDQQALADAEQEEATLIGNQLESLKQTQKGPVASDYYQGITRYKYVKINDSNKNILNASYVKFDANTGLAKVPVKDQAPCAKAVRQMGYYFDYHQWNEQRNKNPEAYKSRPDPRKKKQKKLHLVGMGKDA